MNKAGIKVSQRPQLLADNAPFYLAEDMKQHLTGMTSTTSLQDWNRVNNLFSSYS